MSACHMHRAGAEGVFADGLLWGGLFSAFAAVLISVLAVFAVGHRLSENAVSERNILSPERREHKGLLNCNSPKRVLPSVLQSL